eukprot:scaffold31712_cov65-Phaeocystis_antarctica.AAC.2
MFHCVECSQPAPGTRETLVARSFFYFPPVDPPASRRARYPLSQRNTFSRIYHITEVDASPSARGLLALGPEKPASKLTIPRLLAPQNRL